MPSVPRFGANYVPSSGWFYSWLDYDGAAVRRDFADLAAIGLDHVRVFPVWPWIQPNRAIIRERAIADLLDTIDAAAEHGLSVAVDLIQGHLSSFDFLPSWVLTWHKSSLFEDSTVRDGLTAYVDVVARAVAAKPNVFAITLGNEVNNLWPDSPTTPEASTAWAQDLLATLKKAAPGVLALHSIFDDAWYKGDLRPEWLPGWAPFSAGFLILAFPGLFRFTCYYYRGAYYKGFWADPPSCSVGEPRGTSYWGERWLPLVLHNVHRYFVYIAVLFLFILAYDVYLATQWPTADGGTQFGVGVGTLLLAVNVVLLTSYTLGCHSIRHIVGGFKDEISKSSLSSACYNCSSALNYKHQLFAWCSLFSVMFSDVYIRMCSMGIWTDFRIF